MISKLNLYLNTISHLTFEQTAGRIYALLKKRLKLYKIPNPPQQLNGLLVHKINFIEHEPWNKAAEIRDGNFIFSHERSKLGSPINWNHKNMSAACRLHIHFFNFLYLIDDDEKIDICKSWISYNKIGDKISWQPYSTSLRIFSWIRANLRDEEIDNSIYQQAAFLYRNNEFYIPANHYLENARALIFAGLYFNQVGESSKWLSKGIRIIDKAINEQVEDDGCYYEKSFMYHNIVLQLFTDILNVLPNSYPLYDNLSNTVKKMSDFLISILHPDENIALFSDSVLEMGNDPRIILSYVESVIGYKAKLKYKFDDSGHYVFSSKDIYLIIDAGKIAHPKMPGHAHADIFNYELSLNGKRFIVDTGVGTYDISIERSIMRSTRAHNTLCIDGKDQADLWGSFRMGRIVDPRDISFDLNQNGFDFEGVFDGYSKIIGDKLVHKRNMNYYDNKIVVQDSIEGFNDHLFESMIHLHPDVRIINQAENSLELSLEGNIVIFKVLVGELLVEDSFYYPEMGQRIPNKSVIVYQKCAPPVQLSYSIKF